MDQKYDAVAVAIKGSEVLWVDPNHDFGNAEAITHMAISRQGLADRFFSVTLAGMYKAGDKYNGRGYEKEPAQNSSGMRFPREKRGL